MVSGSECGWASTLEMTGMRGVLIFVLASAALQSTIHDKLMTRHHFEKKKTKFIGLQQCQCIAGVDIMLKLEVHLQRAKWHSTL